MTRISNTDQVLALLRAHLERTQRVKGRRAAALHSPGPLARVHALAGAEDLTDAEIGRALIAGLLAEEFGAALAVDPSFQAIVDQVSRTIDRDEAGRALVRAAIAQLGAAGR